MQKKFYVTAEVGKDGQEPWYPVSLLTVYLEPNADFKTEKELMEEEHYRLQENIEKDYVLLDSISFDATPGGSADYKVITDPRENYRNSTLEKDRSEYAVSATFAYDSGKRASGLRGIFRGEYALFKTLNVAGISTRSQEYDDCSVRKKVNIMLAFAIVIMNIGKTVICLMKWVSLCTWMLRMFPE